MADEILVVVETSTETLEIANETTVTVSGDEITLLSEGLQGPEGIQGQKGDKGDPGGSEMVRTAAVALSGHRAVLIDGQGKFDYVSADNLLHSSRAVGVTIGAASAGAPANVVMFGEITEPTWTWIPDQPVYLGVNGQLTQTMPVFPASKFLQVIGIPMTSTSLFVNIGFPITLI